MPFCPPLYLNEWGGWSVVTGATTLLHVCAERRQTAAAEIHACPLLSAYRLTGPAGIRPQQTERLDWCGCGQEVSLSLSLSLPNSLSMLHSTLWNALARPASPTHRCCCCGVRGSVVPLQQGPCKRLSPGEPRNDASHAVLFLNPSLIWFISLWQGCVLTELLVSVTRSHGPLWTEPVLF